MKVLHFVSHFSLRSETFIYDEVNSLERAFPNSNTVLTFERQLEAERPYHRVVVLNQSLSLVQKLRRRQLKIFKGVRISREFFPLCSYLDHYLGSFDILQAHFGWNAVLLWQALKLLGREKEKPLIVRCQGTDINSKPLLEPDYRQHLLELAGAGNVLLTTLSECMRQKMLRLGIAPERIHPVTNTFNTSFLTHHKQKFFKPGDCLRVINTARFIEWKGQVHLVKAFAKFVREVYENSALTLIGEGETLAPIKRLAEAEGVSNKIHFPGGLPHHDIAHRLAESDLYVHPSIIDPQTFQEEGLPIAVLEAMAVGLPLIVTRTGGMPEIVGEDNTFARIVPDQNADAIFQALKEMFVAGTCFQDTAAYSSVRLAAFSAAKQLHDLKSAYALALTNCPPTALAGK